MAVTATFVADFTDFTKKVQQAEGDLAKLEKSADKMGTTTTGSINTARDSMSKMTSALGPLGAALGITFSIGAVVNFTKSIIASADELVNLSAKTGIGIEALQRLQIVGENAGTTLDRLTAAVTAMQLRLASGASHEALQALGLDIEHIKSLDPDQQFIAIGQAIAGIEEPWKRTAAAAAIGGKAMIEQIPAMLGGLQQIEDKTLIVSERATRAWEQFGLKSGSYWKRFTVAVAEDFGSLMATLQENYARMGQITDDFQTQVARVAAKPPPVPAVELPVIQVDLTAELKKTEDALKAQEDANKKAAEAAKKYGEVLKDVTSFGSNFHATLLELNGDTLAAVQYYARAGVELSKLQTVYGLTDAQVKAITADLKFRSPSSRRTARPGRVSRRASRTLKRGWRRSAKPPMGFSPT